MLLDSAGTTTNCVPSLGVPFTRSTPAGSEAAARFPATGAHVIPPSVERSMLTYSLVPRLLVHVIVWVLPVAQLSPPFGLLTVTKGDAIWKLALLASPIAGWPATPRERARARWERRGP